MLLRTTFCFAETALICFLSVSCQPTDFKSLVIGMFTNIAMSSKKNL